MTTGPSAVQPAPALCGREGELLSLRVSVEPRSLEDLLETLAGLDFPVNPQLYHSPGEVTVEFPAYAARIEEVSNTLHRRGFPPSSLQIARGRAPAGR